MPIIGADFPREVKAKIRKINKLKYNNQSVSDYLRRCIFNQVEKDLKKLPEKNARNTENA